MASRSGSYLIPDSSTYIPDTFTTTSWSTGCASRASGVWSRFTPSEIPAALLGHVERGSRLGAELHDTGKFWTDGDGRTWDTYILAGAAVTNPEALAQMDIPGYESCVEVGREPEGH